MPTSPVTSITATRIAIGTGAWAAPNLTAKLFGMDPENNPQASFLGRLFGIRDIALGVGTSQATGEARKSWLRIGIVCDLADVAAAVLAGRNGTLPKHAAVMAGVTAVVAVGLGAAALSAE